MFIERDLDFWYEQCLQCSYNIELAPLGKFKTSEEAYKGIYQDSSRVAN